VQSTRGQILGSELIGENDEPTFDCPHDQLKADNESGGCGCRDLARGDCVNRAPGYTAQQRQGGEIGRRARLRIPKSTISRHRFSFQKAIISPREIQFLTKTTLFTNDE
jgi:hypothetical protein